MKKATNIRTATRAAVTATALTMLGLGLTACSGSNGLDGTYYDTNSQLIIDGKTVEIRGITCNDDDTEALIWEEPGLTGELTEDETQVVWADRTHGPDTSEITVSASGDVIDLIDTQYTAMDQAAADEVMTSYFDSYCT